MAQTNLLLTKHVAGLGSEGDEVTVKAGFARNFLVPKKMAVPLTLANRKQVEALKKVRAEREAKDIQNAEALKDKVRALQIVIPVRVGESGKLFGAVTAQDLHQKVEEAGIAIERKKIHLYQPVKTLGKHVTQVKLHAQVVVDLEFELVPEEVEESEIVSETATEQA